MPPQLIIYNESQDTGGNLALVASVPDQSMTPVVDAYLVPKITDKIALIYAIGATITQARISSPSLLKQNLIDIPHLDATALPVVDPPHLDLRDALKPLEVAEQLQALVAEGVGGAELESVVMVLVDAIADIDVSDILWIRATGTTTLGVNAWTLVPLILAQQLSSGRYMVVALRAFSANAIAARLVFQEQHERPGCICHVTEEQVAIPAFEPGGLGNWGEFEHTFIPQAEFFSRVADTAETVYFGLKKIA